MNELILSCPPTGGTLTTSGDCNSIKSYCWTTNETGTIDYYMPRYNDILVSFDFLGITNNGSTIVVELIYYQNGVQSIKETWNLGTLTSSIKKYHKFNFGNTPTNNSFQLRVTTTGGTSGCFNVNFDCSVNVTSAQFCSGTTFNSLTNVCECGSSPFFLYADIQDGWNLLFPYALSGVTWYLDPQLQTPAPCGDYTTYGNINPIIYTYDCVNFKSTVKRLCKPVVIDPCTAETITSLYTHTTYTKPNPYLPGTKNIPGNGYILYSEHSTTLDYTGRAQKNMIVPITFYYSGATLSGAYVTLSDPNAAPGLTTGYVSYSEIEPADTPYFLPVVDLSIIKIPARVEKTIWVVIPTSGLLTVRFMAGWGWNVPNKPSKITRITYPCQPITFYNYEMGLHAYSGYDALPANNPKLKTYLYSLIPINEWAVGTNVFSDLQLTQPAFPYNYGYGNKVYSVGVTYPNFSLLREWGTKTDYQVTNKRFVTKINPIIQGPKNWTIFDGTNYKSEACLDLYMDVGTIASITLSTNLKQPSSYLYFMGYNSDPARKDIANNEFFTTYDFKKKKHNPLTGYEHALWKLSGAISKGVQKYMLQFDPNKVNKYLEAISKGLNNLMILTGMGIAAATVVSSFLVASAQIAITFPTSFAGFFAGELSIKFLAAGGAQILCPGALILSAAVAVAVIALVLVTVLFFFGYSKTYRQTCKIFFQKFTNTPYIEEGNTLYNLSGLTGIQNGVYNDGGYFYTQQSGVITKKELSYKDVNGIKTYSFAPDNPTTVVDLTLLTLLPYISGRPQDYYAPFIYKNGRKLIILTPPVAWTGELNNPIDIQYEIEEGTFFSDNSQQEADNLATNFLTGYTAATYSSLISSQDKPGTDDIQLLFTHELKLEDNSNTIVVSYQNDLNTGILLGTKLFIDENGLYPCLTGYYATTETSNLYYKKFYQVNSASTVIDIFTMQNSTDNFVTSDVTSNTELLSQVNKDYTSFWYFTSDNTLDLAFNYNTNNLFNFSQTWGTSEFYNNSIVRRGFIKTPETKEKLYLYNSNYGTASTYSEGSVSLYTNTFLLQPNVFQYITSATTVIDFEQICSLTGNTGVLFTLKDLSGNTVPSIYGVTFNANIYVSSAYDSTHEVTIDSDNTETLLILDPSYMGNITNVTISNYISPNPINNITFTEGTFTPCVAPTPSPTPTSTSPEFTYTPTPTPTLTSTPSSTPAETPSSTPTETPSSTPAETPSSTPAETPASTPDSTPAETPASTLTPTPTPTIPSVCTSYTVADVSNSSPSTFTYQDCTTLNIEEITLTDDTEITICAITGSILLVSGLIDIINNGPCEPSPTPTNTQTPTSTPTSSIVSYFLCMGYDSTDCSTACSDYVNCNL
jgi:hypothetical protein